MTVDKILTDPEFGHIYIKGNARAVRYTFRPAKDGTPQCGILVTVPSRFVLADVQRSVEEMRPRLRVMLQKFEQQRQQPPQKAADGEMSHTRPHIDWDFCIKTDCLHISLVRGNRAGFYLHSEEAESRFDAQMRKVEVLKPAILQVVCPPDCDFDAEGRQQWLEKVIVEGIRSHAKAQLLPRLLVYARLYNIKLHEVKINSSKGRWGSCARHKAGGLFSRESFYNINLSLFTLLLPLPVQRLILLHELTHTRHMDHSPAFHHDLDVWLEGKEKALEQELKRYNTNIFSFI